MRFKILMFIIKLILRKEVNGMSRKKKLAVAFAYLVIDGFMTFEEVYDWLKELTKQALITLGRGDLAGVPEEGEN